ncbi:MAG: prepilin-type N-terminal cleavage/methylation domain-containing protein [Limnochordia bacterium]|nr:prepilin-type N-terminal cleavage/methylation domain-containing protein [Limnochordia bacterium]
MEYGEEGYTLMELMIVISVASILGAMILLVVYSGALVPRQITSWYDSERNLAVVMREISYGFMGKDGAYPGLMQASEAMVPMDGAGISYRDSEGIEVTYTLEGNILYRSYGEECVAVLSDVAAVSFTIDEQGLVEIVLELSKVGNKPLRALQYIALRNAQGG